MSLADLLLGTADQYRFLSGGSIPVPGQSDSENFTQTMDSMAIMGFNPEELMCKRTEAGKKIGYFVSSILAMNHLPLPCLTSLQPC